ncbi:MAG: substrate-binding domain-containing protein [Candidatus Abyssubacteria bacterium]
MKLLSARTILCVISVLAVLSLGMSPAASAEEYLRLATTTSTDNTGLLAALLPPFEAKYKMKVAVIAVGTGKALKLAENGDVDVVLVHAREAEDKFIEKGFGVNRRDVMYNDFVLVGPPDDPAKANTSASATEAFQKIADASAPFISRGDDSGTHQKERSIWKQAGIEPKGTWYMEAGQGMGAVLQIADEKRAYTLTDRGTLLAYAQKLDLMPLYEDEPALFNPYGIIAVNPAVHRHVNYMGAMLLIAWFTSPEGQEIIGNFKTNGQALFMPVAVPMPAASEK